MARQRPVSAVNKKPHQQRSVFSGSNNNLSRTNNYILVLALATHDAMVTAAATFPTPPVSMVNFLNDIQAFQAAKQALGVKGTRGSMAATITLRSTRRVVTDDLAALAGYVQAVARQSAPNQNIWVQYGLVQLARFALKGQRRTPSIGNRTLSAPQAVRSAFSKKNNLAGYTHIRWNKVKGAAAYNVFNQKIVNNVLTNEFTTTVTKTRFSENVGNGRFATYVIQPVDKFGTTGGLSSPLLAYAFVNP